MRILLAAFKQETATFNPARSTREHFKIVQGADLLALSDTRSELGGDSSAVQRVGKSAPTPCQPRKRHTKFMSTSLETICDQ